MMLKSGIAPYITETVKRLQDSGFETYIVGGAVRDAILGRIPKDYDISTSATPAEVRAVFGKKRTFVIGRRFQIVHLHCGRDVIEISTFRREPSKELQTPPMKVVSNELPDNLIFHDNEFGNSFEDAWRRDFTVNAIFYDPIKDELIDHTGMGLGDLRDGVVRCIGEPGLRFEEDPVRILRALKLVGQYDFHLHESITEILPDSLELITHCSKSRLSLELEKILRNSYGASIFRAFQAYGFLAYYLPNLAANWPSPATERMLALLDLRNQRVKEGKYRNSVSLAIACICLPYFQAGQGSEDDTELWENYTGIEYEIRSMIQGIFRPRAFSKRLVASAIKILLLQPKMLNRVGSQKLLRHPSYPHGRELLIMQDQLFWQTDWISDFWPERKYPVKRKKRKRRNRSGRNASSS